MEPPQATNNLIIDSIQALPYFKCRPLPSIRSPKEVPTKKNNFPLPPPSSMKFETQARLAGELKHYKAFNWDHQYRETEIQTLLMERQEAWLKTPSTFWEGVDLSPQSSLKAAFQRVYEIVDDFKDEDIFDPARRRLSLLRLNDFRQTVEERIRDMAENSKAKLQKGSTWRSLLTDVLWSLVSSVKKEKLMDRLRSAEKHDLCKPGIALGSGNVCSYGMERCSQEEFSKFREHCKPMEALDPLGTVLKNALWDPEHHLLEVDEAILFHLSRRMPQSTNDARVSDGTGTIEQRPKRKSMGSSFRSVKRHKSSRQGRRHETVGDHVKEPLAAIQGNDDGDTSVAQHKVQYVWCAILEEARAQAYAPALIDPWGNALSLFSDFDPWDYTRPEEHQPPNGSPELSGPTVLVWI